MRITSTSLVNCARTRPATARPAALELKQILRDFPALVLLADAVCLRHAHVVEEYFVEFVVAAVAMDRTHGNAGQVHIEYQERNAVLAFAFCRSAYKREDAVRFVSECGPYLLAVDDIMIAIRYRAGLERGKIRARARFGIALTPVVFAADNARQIFGLLLGVAELQQDGPDHALARAVIHRRTGAGAFGVEDVGLHRRPAGTAMFLRPRGSRPALADQRLMEVERDVGIGGEPGRQRLRAFHVRRNRLF